jgi:hypothetical protein
VALVKWEWWYIEAGNKLLNMKWYSSICINERVEAFERIYEILKWNHW